jgi:hypothetical protein
MLATLVSALVTCIRNAPPEWTGCPLGGVMRTPMLVGTTSAYLQFCFSSIFMKARRFFQTRPRVNHALAAFLLTSGRLNRYHVRDGRL